MCNDLSDNIDRGKLTGVVLLYIRKAFDSVDHSILLEKVLFYRVLHVWEAWWPHG